MTYRQAIQIQIKALQKIYTNADGLRDVATDQEKNAWNILRRDIPSLWEGLQQIDNNLSKQQAAYVLKGIYNVNENETTI